MLPSRDYLHLPAIQANCVIVPSPCARVQVDALNGGTTAPRGRDRETIGLPNSENSPSRDLPSSKTEPRTPANLPPPVHSPKVVCADFAGTA